MTRDAGSGKRNPRPAEPDLRLPALRAAECAEDELDLQKIYWESVAWTKTFHHPIPLSEFLRHVPLEAKILDYGCGYGRTCSELVSAGYQNVIGIDPSPAMIERGKAADARLDLRIFHGVPSGFSEASFDLCLLVTVLTCIPSDSGQERAIGEIHRLLRPGGILFVSDLPLQSDARNQQRYREFENEFGTHGVFRTGGAVVRHHEMAWIHRLLDAFDIMSEHQIRVLTMNGHEADAFQIMARKRGP